MRPIAEAGKVGGIGEVVVVSDASFVLAAKCRFVDQGGRNLLPLEHIQLANLKKRTV
jgi:hypothetical protein